jgi:hypothetical protein
MRFNIKAAWTCDGVSSVDHSAEYFRERAAQCRRLANQVINQNDPVVACLLRFADELEAKAVEVERSDYAPQISRRPLQPWQ